MPEPRGRDSRGSPSTDVPRFEWSPSAHPDGLRLSRRRPAAPDRRSSVRPSHPRNRRRARPSPNPSRRPSAASARYPRGGGCRCVRRFRRSRTKPRARGSRLRRRPRARVLARVASAYTATVTSSSSDHRVPSPPMGARTRLPATQKEAARSPPVGSPRRGRSGREGGTYNARPASRDRAGHTADSPVVLAGRLAVARACYQGAKQMTRRQSLLACTAWRSAGCR